MASDQIARKDRQPTTADRVVDLRPIVATPAASARPAAATAGEMRYFPLFLDMADTSVLVVGGGECALAKLRLICRTPARIHVASPSPSAGMRKLAASGRIRLSERPVNGWDLVGIRVLYIALEAGEASGGDVERLVQAARSAGILVNTVDDAARSDFLTPAIVDRSPVVVAIGTEGTAPVLARKIKRSLEARLSPRLGGFAAALGRWRDRVAETLPDGLRRGFWNRLVDGPALGTLEVDGPDALDRLIEATLGDVSGESLPRTGEVILVGAGPGDPDLLTLKARKALDRADVVIHDRLVGPGVLELARREAVFHDVGKAPGAHGATQEEINRLIVANAAAGKIVVRLKGGDPSIFGRADEELAAARAAGLPVTIIPGITAASAAAASAGLSLTRRGRNQAITLMTARDANGFSEQDWSSLAQPDAAAAIYMGVGAARWIQGRLILHGADRATPVTIVEKASQADQKIVETTLGVFPDRLAGAGIKGPAIIFIGLRQEQAVSETTCPIAAPSGTAALQAAAG